MESALPLSHMNKGEGEASYAKNSSFQYKILSMTKPIVEEATVKLLGEGINIPKTMAIADLGCASGPNALTAVSEIIDIVDERWRFQLRHQQWPNFMVYLNDLPGNDFNEVFGLLSGFRNKLKEGKGENLASNCFIAGVPGSFYSRLFPLKSLHFVHSSTCLHWLSQVPSGLNEKDNPKMVNKGKIYQSPTSPPCVMNAYKLQFHNDFLLFLKSRSKEVVSGGRMVLSFLGRPSNDPISNEIYDPWELVSHALMTMVSEGIIEEEKVDSFNLPYYTPSLEEVKQLIEEEASFVDDRLQSFEIEWDGGYEISKDEFGNSYQPLTRGQRLAKMHKAVLEPILEHHFGKDIIDELFHRESSILDDHMSNNESKFVNIVISLVRK